MVNGIVDNHLILLRFCLLFIATMEVVPEEQVKPIEITQSEQAPATSFVQALLQEQADETDEKKKKKKKKAKTGRQRELVTTQMTFVDFVLLVCFLGSIDQRNKGHFRSPRRTECCV